MSIDKFWLSWSLLILYLVSSWLISHRSFWPSFYFSLLLPASGPQPEHIQLFLNFLSVFSCCGKSCGHFSPWLFFIHALLVLLLFGGGALFVLSRFIVVSLDSADVNLLYSDHFDEQIDFFKSFLSNSVSVWLTRFCCYPFRCSNRFIRIRFRFVDLFLVLFVRFNFWLQFDSLTTFPSLTCYFLCS